MKCPQTTFCVYFKASINIFQPLNSLSLLCLSLLKLILTKAELSSVLKFPADHMNKEKPSGGKFYVLGELFSHNEQTYRETLYQLLGMVVVASHLQKAY